MVADRHLPCVQGIAALRIRTRRFSRKAVLQLRRRVLIRHLDALPAHHGVLEDADACLALKALYPSARTTRLLEECHAGTDVP